MEPITDHPAFLRLAIVSWRRILANTGNRVKDNSLNLNNFPLLMGSDCVLIIPAATKWHSLMLTVTVFAESGSQRFWFKSVTSLKLNFRGILRLWALTTRHCRCTLSELHLTRRFILKRFLWETLTGLIQHQASGADRF